ncbi:MAG: threonine/serine exporter family protein [Bifidobacteriaceae bacterium]|nr:threonine/serine exporter family protein [Bifidobacteriaceae bacterium]MCI1979014.1 threonine/serine exporter family protein [Bifidobacteriaceae bacterium]
MTNAETFAYEKFAKRWHAVNATRRMKDMWHPFAHLREVREQNEHPHVVHADSARASDSAHASDSSGNSRSLGASRSSETSHPSGDGQPAAARLPHSHAIPLDMEDIVRDYDKPIEEAGIAAKSSVIVRVGQMDLAGGTGGYRVREMMHRISYPLGVHTRADVNLTDIEATCTDGSHRLTEVVDLPTTGVNTWRIWQLEHFTDWFNVKLGQNSVYSKHPHDISDGPLTVRTAHRKLDEIERKKPLYSPAFAGLASALACGAFVYLLGGGIYDIIGAFMGAGIGHWLRRRMFAHRLNQFFVTGISVAVAALVCVGTLRLIGFLDPSALEHDTAYIGAMLFVIPGFPLVTGGLDIAKLDFPSGLQRLAYATSIIVVATLAAWAVARMVQLNPQGFPPLGLDPWLNGALRFVAAFIGVWGFSVLFNSPQRMALVAAFIGAIADTLRLEIQDFWNVPPEAAAFLCALVAGLLATAWRSAVRHGALPPSLGFPRICLTVPSIVIMVPGLYLYRAVFYLGQFDTLNALNWGFRGIMVILCLPIGLAFARVLTDSQWRYDV